MYADAGDLQMALATIDKAIATDPTEANYYDSKGEFLLRSGDKEEAVKMWMKVESLDPNFTDTHYSWLYEQLVELGILKPMRRKQQTQ